MVISQVIFSSSYQGANYLLSKFYGTEMVSKNLSSHIKENETVKNKNKSYSYCKLGVTFWAETSNKIFQLIGKFVHPDNDALQRG